MNILWITNIMFPEAQRLLLGNGTLKATGGWLLGAADILVKQPKSHLSVASLSRSVSELTHLHGEHIDYYLLPYGNGNERINHEYEPLWKKVRDAVKPDVVHIHGTEYSHGLAYIEACGADNVCVSIQGLVSAYYYYYYYGLTKCEIRRSSTVASMLRGGILKGYRNFKKRGEYEKEIIRRVHHIIGRTSWDHDRTWAINPEAVYHYGGETLRPEFYKGDVWSYKRCEPHTIFLSQAGYPIKGLHQVLKALPLVLRHYPDTKLRIAGSDITDKSTFKRRLKLSDYGRVIQKLITKHNLQSHVCFTGQLDADCMKKEYLASNVFICPSSIENSPNSVGEAQVLGVPILASYVGGIMDMMRGDEEHLYRFEEIEMLAYKIVKIFRQKDGVSTNYMRKVALKRHDPVSNVSELMNIYRSIINDNNV